MTSDLETLLRETLANRAETVHRGPSWQPPTSPAHFRRFAPLIAAAVVAAIAGSLVLIDHDQSDNRPAGPNRPTPSPSRPSRASLLPNTRRRRSGPAAVPFSTL